MPQPPRIRTRLIVLGLTAAAAYFGCPFRLSVVEGHSMEPTLRPGALCILDRGYYARHPMRQGDVVVFELGPQVLTKRVYGAPGDSILLVEYRDHTYEVPSPEQVPRLERLAKIPRRTRPTARLTRLRVPPGHCFVVGDNRAASEDSRSFGLVETADVLGKLIAAPGAGL